MVDKKAGKTPDKKVTDKDYFEEAKSWDEDSTFKEKIHSPRLDGVLDDGSYSGRSRRWHHGNASTENG